MAENETADEGANERPQTPEPARNVADVSPSPIRRRPLTAHPPPVEVPIEPPVEIPVKTENEGAISSPPHSIRQSQSTLSVQDGVVGQIKDGVELDFVVVVHRFLKDIAALDIGNENDQAVEILTRLQTRATALVAHEDRWNAWSERTDPAEVHRRVLLEEKVQFLEKEISQLQKTLSTSRSKSRDKKDTAKDAVMNAEQQAHKQPSTHAHLAVMFSSPLVIKDVHGRVIPMAALDHKLEEKLLLSSLRESNARLGVRQSVATIANLTTILSNGCTALHFSGHGFALGDGSDALVFEDGEGSGHILGQNTLAKILAVSGHTLELVFVASCHSRLVGEVFIRSGVRRVVCIRREDRVLDKASQLFAATFYHTLFTSSGTVQRAFDVARARVAAEATVPDSEVDKFILLKSDNMDDSILYPNLRSGPWYRVTDQPIYNDQLPSMEQMFVGRNNDMYETIRLVVKQRLVTIRGPPGIGKTSMAKAVAHFLHERSVFADGVLFVSLRGASTESSVHSYIGKAFRQCSDPTLRSLPIDCESHVLWESVRSRKVLIVLDNTEDSLNSTGVGPFRQFLQEILDRVPESHILVTSRQPIGGGAAGFCEKTYTLNPLSDLEAAKLFDKCSPRKITLKEIGCTDKAHALHDLASHKMFKFLGGHPQAISLAAPLLSDRKLDELYELLVSKSVDALQVENIPVEERSAVNTLVVSLELSIDHLRCRGQHQAITLFSLFGFLPSGARAADFDMFWETYHKLRHEARGLEGSDDESVCSSDSGAWMEPWRGLMTVVLQASLVVKKNNLYLKEASKRPEDHEMFTTFPFITQFAERLITLDDRMLFNIITCRHFANICETLANQVGVPSEESEMGYAVLQTHELNFWACLRRAHEAAPAAIAAALINKNIAGIDDLDENREKSEETANECYSPSGSSKASVSSPIVKVSRAAFLCDVVSDVSRLGVSFATVLFLAGRPHEGIDAAKIALDIVKATNDILGHANLRKFLGVVYARLNDSATAKSHLGKAKLLYSSAGSVHGQAATSSALGYLQQQAGNIRGAVNCFNDALVLYNRVRHRVGMLETRRWLARLQSKLPDGAKISEEHYAAMRVLQRDIVKRPDKVKNFVEKWLGVMVSLHLEVPPRVEPTPLQAKHGAEKQAVSAVSRAVKSTSNTVEKKKSKSPKLSAKKAWNAGAPVEHGDAANIATLKKLMDMPERQDKPASGTKTPPRKVLFAKEKAVIQLGPLEGSGEGTSKYSQFHEGRSLREPPARTEEGKRRRVLREQREAALKQEIAQKAQKVRNLKESSQKTTKARSQSRGRSDDGKSPGKVSRPKSAHASSRLSLGESRKDDEDDDVDSPPRPLHRAHSEPGGSGSLSVSLLAEMNGAKTTDDTTEAKGKDMLL